MTTKLMKMLWKFLDLICYILGFGSIVGALFLWSTIAGLIGLGIVLITTSILIDSPSITGRGGGDR